MTEEIIDRYEVRHLQVLDVGGNADEALIEEMPEISDDDIKLIFERIVSARIHNGRAISLQREGRIGTYASIYGQEAAGVGIALAIEDGDWVFPSFRDTAILLSLGYPPSMLFRYWAGDERSMKCPENLNILPLSVPVGTHIPHASGAAMAMKLKGDKAASIAIFGDGATSKGDFHEGLNFAGVFSAPAVFVCMNNQWAISVPFSKQTAAESIAVRARGYGFEGIRVDGNDPLATYLATRDALKKAREGGGPTLIECLTYRLDHHTTADDSRRYRSEDEVEEWTKREPLARLRKFMEARSIWSEEYEKNVTEEAERVMDEAVLKEEHIAPPEPADIIRYTNSVPTHRQTEELRRLGWLKES